MIKKQIEFWRSVQISANKAIVGEVTRDTVDFYIEKFVKTLNELNEPKIKAYTSEANLTILDVSDLLFAFTQTESQMLAEQPSEKNIKKAIDEFLVNNNC